MFWWRQEKKVSSFWSSVGFKIGAVTLFFFFFFFFFSPLSVIFFLPAGKYVIHGDQISHLQSMVAKRGLTNRANVYTPMWKCRLKHSTAEFQWIQQIFAAIGHRFIANKKKIKNTDERVWGDACGDQKPETSFGGLKTNIDENWQLNNEKQYCVIFCACVPVDTCVSGDDQRVLFCYFVRINMYQACGFSWFFFTDFRIFYKSPLASKLSWKKRNNHQGKKEVVCIVSKSLVCGHVESL